MKVLHLSHSREKRASNQTSEVEGGPRLRAGACCNIVVGLNLGREFHMILLAYQYRGQGSLGFSPLKHLFRPVTVHFVPALPLLYPGSVSYTHLTLPTNREV